MRQVANTDTVNGPLVEYNSQVRDRDDLRLKAFRRSS